MSGKPFRIQGLLKFCLRASRQSFIERSGRPDLDVNITGLFPGRLTGFFELFEVDLILP